MTTPLPLPQKSSSEPQPQLVDRFAHDAPIVDLLSLSKNPILATLTDAELTQYAKRVRELSSPQTLSAAIAKDSERIKATKSPAASKRAQKQSILDSL